MQVSGKTRVIVHVGHPKTGTTYIQESLAASRAALRNAGIDYPLYTDEDFARSKLEYRPHGNCRVTSIVS